jgi:hypothetical protein
VDPSTAPHDDIFGVLDQLDGESELVPHGSLRESLAALITTAKEATAAYLGLAITVLIDDQPILLTVIESSGHANVQAASSLSLSLSWLPTLDPGSRITFYAVTPGAFLDLAADLTFALGGVALQIDDDITNAPIAGLTGVETLTAINHAVGILLGHGHSVETAQAEMRRRASTLSGGIHQVAVDIAADPTNASRDRPSPTSSQ